MGHKAEAVQVQTGRPHYQKNAGRWATRLLRSTNFVRVRNSYAYAIRTRTLAPEPIEETEVLEFVSFDASDIVEFVNLELSDIVDVENTIEQVELVVARE